MAAQTDNLLINDDATGFNRSVEVAIDDLFLSVDLTLQSGAVFESDNIKRGVADPTGVVSGNEGDLYLRTGIGLGSLYVNTDGTVTGWSQVLVAATVGDVSGPASSTDNALVRFDGVTGKLIQNSGVLLSDANALTGASSYNGVVIESHASRHLPGGADPLATAAPVATAVRVGNAAAVGVAASFARSDHIHAVAAGTPVNVTKSANAAGTALTFARSDHKHDVTTATAVSVGTANAEGSATSLARSDHTHAVTGFSISGQAQGDILYYNGTSWVRLPAGTAGQLLTTQGAAANPAWTSPKRYPNSGVDPVSPAPATGDRYYNTTLEMEMTYDGTRSKWLSVESDVFTGSDAFFLANGVYLQSGNVRMSSTLGYTAHYNGTVVSLGYTRDNLFPSSFQVTSGGLTIATVAFGASASGQDTTLNADFTQGSILGIRNGGAGTMVNPIAWVRVRWRA